MRNIITTAAFLLFPVTAFAGGHAEFGGHGTGVRSDMKTIEATSGTHVQVTTSDLWIYDNPPEGFPAAQKSNCNYFQAFATGQQQPIGGVGTCQAQDPDGDISLWNGIFQPNGTIAVTVIAGTGKWSALVGAKFQGKTRLAMDGASIYDFSPLN